MSDTEQQAPQATPEPTPSSQVPATSQGAQAETEGNNNEATFTQADVDRIVSERAKRASETAISKFLESLGVESAEQAKTTFEEARKRKEAEMSEIEKAQVEIDKAKAQAKEALEAKAKLEQQILDNGRKQAFLKAVSDSGGNQADHLFILVQATKGDEFASVFGEGASPDDAKMKAFIKGVQSDFPTYFGSAGAGSPSNANGVAPKTADFTEEAMATWRNRLRS